MLRLPIAHGEGHYVADDATLDSLFQNKQVLFTYCDAQGRATPEANPNGSQRNIAGITNRAGNVLGLMPHPERASEKILGSDDGLGLFTSILASVKAGKTFKIANCDLKEIMSESSLSTDNILPLIQTIRGQRVILASDLAKLYGSTQSD